MEKNIDVGNVKNIKDFNEIFSDYDKSGVLPLDGFSVEDLETHKRVKSLIKIIDLVSESLKDRFKDYGNLNIEITPQTAAHGTNKPLIDAWNFELNNDPLTNNVELNVDANVNFDKLAQMPAPEAFAALYFPFYTSILKNVEKRKENIADEVDFQKAGQSKRKDEKKQSDPSIFSYIKRFIAEYFGLDFASVDEQSIHAIAGDLQTGGVTREQLFENPNGQNLLAERFAKVSKQSHQQQATALLGVFSKKEFNSIVNGSDSELQDFCKKFADQFLQNSGIDQGNYKITFGRAGGDLGRYRDHGVNGQEIIIDINAIRKLGNPAEALMTLAHELTHMVDSSVNKELGNVSRRGMGLSEHNLVGSVDQNATGFLREMEDVYYLANPHERSARQGELVALEFMMGMNPNPTMKAYIDRSLKGFKNYQKQTLTALQTRVDSLIAKYESQRNSLGYDAKTMQYIETVMEDLKQMKAKGILNIKEDLKALEDANAMENDQSINVNYVSGLGE